MKRIMIFIGMKLAELAAIVFVPWGVGILANKNAWFVRLFHGSPVYLDGFMILAILAMIIMIAIFAIFIIIPANWEWAKRLAK